MSISEAKKQSLCNFSNDELLEKSWEQMMRPPMIGQMWNPIGDYAMDLHFSPTDLVLKSCILANLDKLNQKTLLNKLSFPLPVSGISVRLKLKTLCQVSLFV